METRAKRGRIGFTTTRKFRNSHPEEVRHFVFNHLYALCSDFEILCTGGTYGFLGELLKSDLSDLNQEELDSIATYFRRPMDNEEAFLQWKNLTHGALTPLLPGIQGMVELTYELVESRLDAAIHLRGWDEVDSALDSQVLRREANVHNIPIILDLQAARLAVAQWNSQAALSPTRHRVFPEQSPIIDNPFKGIDPHHRVLALVAHDGMKLEMCRFAVEHASHIFNRFDHVLSTGTTGSWLKKFMQAAGRSERELDSVRCCLSGPLGGDVQIAMAIIKGLCNMVIFFQDPFVSHPHETDIRLFEQIALLEGTEVAIATNEKTARVLLRS